MSATILWFRQDLRLDDNPALDAAVKRGYPVLPVYVLDPDAQGRWSDGPAARWWLHHALADLENALGAFGVRLILRQGDTRRHLDQIVEIGRAHV